MDLNLNLKTINSFELYNLVSKRASKRNILCMQINIFVGIDESDKIFFFFCFDKLNYFYLVNKLNCVHADENSLKYCLIASVPEILIMSQYFIYLNLIEFLSFEFIKYLNPNFCLSFFHALLTPFAEAFIQYLKFVCFYSILHLTLSFCPAHKVYKFKFFGM